MLAGAVQLWTSPTVRDAESLAKVTLGAGSLAKGNDIMPPLAVQASWFTPQGRDWKDTGPSQGNRKDINLGVQAHRCAGPPAPERPSTLGKRHDWSTPRCQDEYERTNWKTVVKVNEEGGDLTLPRQTRYMGGKVTGQLNHRWVAQLQGMPPDWCDLPPATIRSLREKKVGSGGKR